MRFISNGDFILPLHFPMYLAQHIYIWSYERGAINPDGIIRLPGRLIDIAVFALVGNIGFGYFYLASCLLIAFASFWWFARNFLGARPSIAAFAALFFACNPIFLGNLSKVGLILAAAMLPIVLTALKQGFQKKRFGYFLLVVVAMNISLLHPFTFLVNLLVGLGYAVVLARKQLPFLRDNTWKIAVLGLTSILLNAYFILPLYSLRTLDKSSMSVTVSSSPTDYASLVDIANTGDILTGMSLSKGVLKDYEFYGPMTWPFYFLGVMLFYILLFGVFIATEKRIKPHERRRFVLSIGVFLGLLVLATASYLYADVLIKFLIGLPGGWMFRSPLKWQLYMPLVLFTALVIVLKNVRDRQRIRLLYIGFAFCFLLMNGYLFKQIYQRLLTPRPLTYFSELERMPLAHKSLLFVDSATCFDYAQDTPALATELNQVLISKPIQVKHAQVGEIDTVNLSPYDFVMGCEGTLDESLLTKSYDFRQKANFADGKYQLYQNQRPQPYVGAVAQIFALKESQEIGGKYAISKTMGQPFNFITATEATSVPATDLHDLFEDLGPSNITPDRIHAPHSLSDQQSLLIKDGPPIFFAQKQDRLDLSPVQAKGMESAPGSISIAANGANSEVTYSDSSYSYQNIISNPSLENGTWQERVGDCNAYDNKPSLSMRLNRQAATDGMQSLELTARTHIACTGPDVLQIKAGQHYLLSFDYWSNGERDAGYYAGFDDFMITSTNARLPGTEGKWKSFSTEIIAPADAEKIRLLVYAYPQKSLNSAGLVGYDNFKLIAIPEILNRFFVVDKVRQAATDVPKVEYTKMEPTKTRISVKNARNSFYLITKEGYHRLWSLEAGGSKLTDHLRVNATMNGWYIDPNKLCAQNACIKQGDGSYNFELTMEFTPQRWLYIGCLISGVTAILVILFLTYDLWRGRRGR